MLAILDVAVVTGSSSDILNPFDPSGSGFIAGNSILAHYTYKGDVNLDGKVDGGDYGLLDSTINSGDTHPEAGRAWLAGDANFDMYLTQNGYGVVDYNDWGTIDSNLTNGSPPL
jgi:hypothetical protein